MVNKLELTPRMAAVLRVFLAEPTKQQFGFDLMETLDLSSGTLYPILTRLRQAGWITVETEDIDPKAEGRPARRYHQLTAEGEVAAVQALARMRALYDLPPSAAQPGLAGGTA